MFYKDIHTNTENQAEILTGTEEIDTKKYNEIKSLNGKNSRANQTHFELQSLFKRLFSTDDKLILLEYIRDEIRKTNESLFPSFQGGYILNEVLKIFSLNNISYNKLVLQIFQQLIYNNSQFSTYIVVNESYFFHLLNQEQLFTELFTLFSMVIKYNPNFADDLHAQYIAITLFNICETMQDQINTELIVAVSGLICSMIETNKLFSNFYQNDESQLDYTYRLVSISHFITRYLSNLFSEKPKKKIDKDEIKKKNEKYYELILKPLLLLINSLCYSKLSSAQQLFNDSVGFMLFNFLSKGKYVLEICDIFISLVKNFQNASENFLDNFGLIDPLKRHAYNPKYQMKIIQVLFLYSEKSPKNSRLFNEYEFLQVFEKEVANYPEKNKEQLYKLFCAFTINIPAEMSQNPNLNLYLQDCIDMIEAMSDDFIILLLKAVLALINLQNFNIKGVVDVFELSETLSDHCFFSANEEIVALSNFILTQV